MADIKWIKITTDIFDDEKILLIESLPEADSIIVIWFKLLCLAGKMNNSGVFLLSDKIAYTDKMLATIFRRKESTVQLALKTFEQFGMIEILDGVITIELGKASESGAAGGPEEVPERIPAGLPQKTEASADW
ncbi:phage replisome organizer N-terminal domain-containing protein [Blautia sp. OF09-25XD]|uniref:phage replisome organizer N-terminal domain-containing protein n=1 Tax=Blautia sp. OF09-25XD TaxID=2292981 RepID=UPI0018F30363|nr:phage replisome organizer N-terminal domain-containing protein [Blautia sp. OF09-25XD]